MSAGAVAFVLFIGVVACLWLGRPLWAVICAFVCLAVAGTTSTFGGFVASVGHAVQSAFNAGAGWFS